ncbi:hypothetical protein AMS68_002106 [Peltaster fructicola]|uniref:Zn(2)-C6 fungal-type domain-containing protein n=1 Tax=Peltaster fructicola TaxID=286661 RepID=A0A6H0XPP0_9PEZI|nr:hypothetical protein AMS68_002106 [Peltaster fructicola]
MSARRPRLKSRNGCQNCKRRRKKCDESRPVCGDCARLQLNCHWELRQISTSKQALDLLGHIRVLSHVPRLRVAAKDFDCVDYFYSRLLPSFTTCQPAIAWGGILSCLIYNNVAFRKIVAAIGSQHRTESDVAYYHALTFWRMEVSTYALDQAPIMVVGCLLFIILESLRGSKANLTLHLRNAVRIVNTTMPKPALIAQIRPFLGILQGFCTSAWLYTQSGTGDKNLKAMMDVQFRGTIDQLLQGEEDDQLEVNWLIMQVMKTRVDATMRRCRGETADDLPRIFEELKRRANRVRDRVADASSMELRATYVRSLVLVAKLGGRDSKEFGLAVDAIEQLILPMGREKQRNSFSLGLDLINTLEVIITGTVDPETKSRALALLSVCPEREGLWQARSVQQVLCSEVEEDKVERKLHEGVAID